MSAPKTHPLEWVSLGFAVVALSHTEWSLAVAAGAHPIVAMAVPGALDVYAIRAMRARRHVPVVVLAMLAVNALGYLVHAGVLAMTWPVLIVVSAIAPLTFAAVHALGHGNALEDMTEARKRALWDVPSDAVLDRAPAEASTADTFDAHALSAPGVRELRPAAVPDFDPVRAAWQAPDPDTVEHAAEHEHSATVLTFKLPSGYKHDEPSTIDMEHAHAHRAWYDRYVTEHGQAPALRTVKTECRMGTDRARAVLALWKEDDGHGTS